METDTTPPSEHTPAPLGYARPGTNRRANRWTPVIATCGFFACLLVGAGIFGLLTPSLGRSSETANRVKCAANLKAIANTLLLYANDNGGNYPDNPAVLIGAKYDFTQYILLCPSSPDELLWKDGLGADVQKIYQRGRPEDFALTPSRPWLNISYVYAGKGLTVNAPAKAILAYEMLSNHADDGMNALFGDGSVEWMSRDDAAHMINELQIGHNPPRAEKIK